MWRLPAPMPGRLPPSNFVLRPPSIRVNALTMTATEDWLELEHPGWKLDRTELIAARRRMECKLWP